MPGEDMYQHPYNQDQNDIDHHMGEMEIGEEQQDDQVPADGQQDGQGD